MQKRPTAKMAKMEAAAAASHRVRGNRASRAPAGFLVVGESSERALSTSRTVESRRGAMETRAAARAEDQKKAPMRERDQSLILGGQRHG